MRRWGDHQGLLHGVFVVVGEDQQHIDAQHWWLLVGGKVQSWSERQILDLSEVINAQGG